MRKHTEKNVLGINLHKIFSPNVFAYQTYSNLFNSTLTKSMELFVIELNCYAIFTA